jgi:transposase
MDEPGAPLKGTMMLTAFVFRLYPSTTQRRTMEHTVETCRRWYNACLAERKTAYEERGVTIGKYDQLANVKVIKANNPYAAPIHSHVLQVTVADLDKAFQNFFRRVKAGDTPGYPRFKGRNRFHSFGFQRVRERVQDRWAAPDTVRHWPGSRALASPAGRHNQDRANHPQGR